MSDSPTAPSAPRTDPWPLRQRFVVTYHDVDALNHLNHATYFPFMETLRCAYYMPLIGASDPRELDIILAEASCRYLAPAGYGTEMVGEVAPAAPIGRTSFSLVYRFHRPEDSTSLYARGRTVIVCYDYEKGEKKPIVPAVRARLATDAIPLESEGWSPR
ncbi:MAG: acyl-CoA thioesterase [Thermoplasmata archaeon]|nr:acyl-CoA thioesterase [Thermoplasmata archaeon]MCI4338388.1 acyl-CoA thioesterase [Thermoplasmata archaeon]MCI4340867.1 acyl-CoA thioesterase [Thermoplasmata archaeon]